MSAAPTAGPMLRLAVSQALAAPGDPAENLRRLDRTAADAAAGGATLLLTPEMGLSGYAIGADAVRRLAEPADGPIAQAVAAIARRHRLAIVYGYPERAHDADGSPRVYNAAQLIDATGTPRLHYRKTHRYGAIDAAQFDAGDRLGPVAMLDGWQVGLLICYDVEFPEAVRTLALQGADLVLVPTANMVGFDAVATTLVPARAWENACMVAYANTCGAEGEVVYGGLSVVASADGRVLAQAGRDAALLLVDLDRGALAAARAAQPYLRDRRPALYRDGAAPTP